MSSIEEGARAGVEKGSPGFLKIPRRGAGMLVANFSGRYPLGILQRSDRQRVYDGTADCDGKAWLVRTVKFAEC